MADAYMTEGISRWAEITSLEHGHGGPGWEIGKCLWSPSADDRGNDRYAVMRAPEVEDIVVHFSAGIDAVAPRARFLFGLSKVAERCVEVRREPPQPGDWGGRSGYYRIELKEFEPLRPPVSMSAVEDALADVIAAECMADDRPRYYPYSKYGSGFRVSQGIYLARLTPMLWSGLSVILDRSEDESDEGVDLARAFNEGERYRREQALFRRDPALRREALRHYGTTCAACDFDFGKVYGPLGEGYVELHHLDPLSERAAIADRSLTTTLADVAPLCANCHRMVHRRRPALSLEELKVALRKAV